MWFNENANKENLIKVEIQVVFLSLHDIDTTSEKFTGEIYIESRWPIEVEFPHVNVEQLKDHCTLMPFKWKPNWSPELKIANIISESKHETWYRIGEDQHQKKMFIFEIRKFQGIFYEKLELHHYPFDVQQLQLKLISNRYSNECRLMANKDKISKVILENFRDSQEWKLFKMVDTQQDEICFEYSVDEGEHSTISFYCTVARKPGYFYWNAFFLIFLLSVISFNIFGITHVSVGQRLQTSITLILTSVSFKWVINRTLPPIAYLTTLDFYSIFCILYMSLLACWHGIIGAVYARLNNPVSVDTCFFKLSLLVYLSFNAFFLLWHYTRHYGPRREFIQRERTYLRQLNRDEDFVFKNPIKYFY